MEHIERAPPRNLDGSLNFDWDNENDTRNPFNWSRARKWRITVAVLLVSVLFGLPAGAYGAGNYEMSRLFGIPNEKFPYLYLATTSWNVGAALVPLIFVPLTESSGRRPGYFGAYIVFLLFLIPCALAQNFGTMILCRFFGGGASSVAINIVGGTISDIWKGAEQRSFPLSLFGTTSVVGIALGPFFGGLVIEHLSFRWIYWILLLINGAYLPICWFVLVETRGDIILAQEAKKWRRENPHEDPKYASTEIGISSLQSRLRISCERPIKMLCTEWVVFSQTVWVSFAWGLLFLFQSSIPQTFGENYGMGQFETSLIQLAISVGAIVATIINPIQDRSYLRSAARSSDGQPIPESRLYSSVPGSLLFTAGIICYGWASYPNIFWFAPLFGVGLVGLGIYSIYLAVVNYLSDSYEKYAASALSAASLGRNAFGAFLPLASPAIYARLGTQWGSSMLGFIALILTLAPVIMILFGENIRKHSPFMKEATFGAEDDKAGENGSTRLE
ncbi:BgTH12-07095 [Blumeria graminis f. sp. triticale]|uniref:BgtA-20965 n=3 Tax=Blumeria graminis TaxID=34373 RepID=A0A9X9MQ95_BLUGR|nr:hypothetical protein BGT96224_A20965 [Blumeria graminis f. sp. tritici 96224]CAD6506165.1 BgTH12-07095 [Blumeria graminis f. sp. triticale]VDB94860.1 BgtA-20965 [Blumeria graminis f. sp. tritici]